MTTKNCANVPKLVLKDLCEMSFLRNVLYSNETIKEQFFRQYGGTVHVIFRMSYNFFSQRSVVITKGCIFFLFYLKPLYKMSKDSRCAQIGQEVCFIRQCTCNHN